MTEPIIKTLDVNCSPEKAFEVFVTRIGTWWPLAGHSSSAGDGKDALDVTIEPRVGGAFFETRHDGAKDLWGEVLEYSPGEKFASTWHPGNNKDHPTRLDVVFEAAGEGGCRVTLTHSGWEAWADRAEEMRGNYNGGWDIVFGENYAGAFI